MNAVKLSLSILIWICLASCLFLIFSKIVNDLSITVKSCLTKLHAKVLLILREELPEGGWIRVKVTVKEELSPLEVPVSLSPRRECIILKDGDSLVIKEN